MTFSKLNRISILSLATAFALLLAAAAPAGPGPDPATYPLGANLVPAGQGGGTVFRVWAPNASSAVVRGEFNGWSASANPLTLEGASGIWSAHVAGAGDGDEYKYFLNGSLWRVDPRSRNSVNSTGNSIIESDGSDYAWQATSWETPPHEEMVIYELHVGTFSGNSDGVANYPATFRDVVDAHLDHLIDLGVNMVELMPVHEFPGGQSWGYNPSNLFAPESNYGGPDDLRYLVDTLHQNGIGVIMDVVYNHIGPSDNNLWDFDGSNNIYFYSGVAAQTPWGDTRPDYQQEQVRRLLIDNALLWLEEYRMDGLRFDATAFMHGYAGEVSGEGWNLLQQFTEELHTAHPKAILIAEELPNLDLITAPIGSGGRNFDAQWSDAFHDVMRAELAGTNFGTSPDMGAIAGIIANSGFGRPNNEAVKFSESHDESGNAERLPNVIDSTDAFSVRARGLTKVAGGLALMSPGIPMLFMGQEFHEDKQFDDGAADRIWWGFLSTYGGVVDYYGTLGRLRTSRESLLSTSGVQIISVNEGADVVAFQRFGGGDVTFVIANFSATNFPTYNVGVPAAGTWFELVNSQSAAAVGNGMTNGTLTASASGLDGQPATLSLTLPQYSLLVFSQTDLDPIPVTTSAFVLD